jgi:hypothetical protein
MRSGRPASGTPERDLDEPDRQAADERAVRGGGLAAGSSLEVTTSPASRERNEPEGQYPRAIHSSRCGASAPMVVDSP